MRKIIFLIFLSALFYSAKAAVSFSYTSPICGTLNASFTNTSTGFNLGYLWFFDDPGSGVNNYVLNLTKITQSHTFTSNGTYKVKLYILSAASQPLDSTEHTIKVADIPFLFLSPDTFPTYCIGDSINTFLTAASNPAYKYTWNPLPSSSSSSNSVEYRFKNTQTYTVTVLDTTTGCSNSKSATVRFVNCVPLTSQFSFPTVLCGVFTVNFKNTSLSSHHCKWYFGDLASGINDTLSKFDTSSVNHTFSDTGTYYVSLVVFDSLETKKDSSVKQVVIFKLGLATIDNNDTTICMGTKVLLTGSGMGTASWSPALGLSTTSGYATIATPQNTMAPTTYYLFTNNNGCNAVDSVTITVLMKPDPQFSTDTLCMNELFTFNANSSGYPSYHWDFGTGDTAAGASALYSFDTSGVFNVKLSVSNGLCDSSMVAKVVVIKDPIADFVTDKNRAEITKAIFQFSNRSLNSSSFSWDFGDLTTSVDYSPMHTFSDTGWFKVTLTAFNSQGCVDTFSRWIRVDNAYVYFIPSAFSPNLGGPYENEIFKALGPEGTSKYEMLIFDRWGQEVFKSLNEKTPWDGKFSNGTACPLGDYLYMITFKDPTGKRLFFKGIVTLCR